MASQMFDMRLRAMRRDRAFRIGGDLFLQQRGFDECLERIGAIRRRFESILLLGCVDPRWPERLRSLAQRIVVADPGPLFAGAAGGTAIVEDRWELPRRSFDLCLAIGTLDTVNDLPRALHSIRTALRDDAFFLGAFAGGDSLPQLRLAMRAADAVSGAASAHVHPRIEAAAVAPLLAAAGFVMPVVDVDRVAVSYASLGTLIADLRAMGATNTLQERSRRPLGRAAVAAAEAAFQGAGDGRTVESFEILHFAAWTPAASG